MKNLKQQDAKGWKEKSCSIKDDLIEYSPGFLGMKVVVVGLIKILSLIRLSQIDREKLTQCWPEDQMHFGLISAL